MNWSDSIQVFNEDCMVTMSRYPDNYFDLAIVDPPYGYGDKETDILNFRQKEQHREWNIAPSEDYFKELFRVSKNQIIWGGNYFPFIWNHGGRCFIYWHKGNPVSNFADGELAWTSFDKNAKQFDFRYYGNHEGKTTSKGKIHPTQKPISLYLWVYKNFSEKGFKIIDTHFGSGNHGIALDSANKIEKMELTLVASEIDKDYFNDAKKRFEKETMQLAIF